MKANEMVTVQSPETVTVQSREIVTVQSPEMVYANGLQVSYGRRPALQDISFSLPRGEIIGLVGENGSGKSTLMRLLAGMIPSYRGEVRICGMTDLWKAKTRVSFLPSVPFFEKEKNISQTIECFSGLFPGYRKEMAQTLCARFGLSLSEKLSAFSTGRLALALFILHISREADLCLLDEPFRGIDIKTRQAMKDVLIETVSPEKTFLISTHEILEMEPLFDRIILLKEGHLVFDEAADSLRERTGKAVAEVIREAM